MMPGRLPGSGVGKHNAKSTKQGSKRFNSITKRIHFAHLGILFIYARDLLGLKLSVLFLVYSMFVSKVSFAKPVLKLPVFQVLSLEEA